MESLPIPPESSGFIDGPSVYNSGWQTLKYISDIGDSLIAFLPLLKKLLKITNGRTNSHCLTAVAIIIFPECRNRRTLCRRYHV